MVHCKDPVPCWEDRVCRFKGECISKVITNSDRIRSMTDEELARWLDNFFWGAKKVNLFDILKWLKQPVEVER